jgi:putative MATE family efflux protein
MINKKTDLIHGGILQSLFLFAVPLFISRVFQQLYNTADMVIAGYFLGEMSLAAIGAGTVIFEFLIVFTMGIGGGFGIVVSRSYGAGDENHLKRTVAGSIVLGAVLTIFISVFAGVFLLPILKLLNTPSNILHETYTYLLILIIFTIVLFAYNLCVGLLRAIGNSFVPLLFLILSSVLNVGLNILFVAVFDMGIKGLAAATIIAQGFSFFLCIIYIAKKCPILKPKKSHFRHSAELYKELLTQGLSMGFMMSIVSIGTVILQWAINGLGYLFIAGHVAARKINSFCWIPISSLAMALSTFVSQNKGANQAERIRKAVRYCNIFGVIWCVFISVIILFSSSFFMRLLTGSNESVIIKNGSLYLLINTPFYVVLSMLLNLRLALQGIGEKIVPVISSVIELAGKVVFAFLLVPALGYFGVIICEPVIWCVMCLQLLFSYYRNPYIRNRQ